MRKRAAYAKDLAYIHDAGFSDFARNAAPGLLAALRRNGVRTGTVVDLGCGSGIWAHDLIAAGYDVIGVDISGAMIDLARKRAPEGRFVHASAANFDLPPCDAVTSIGECLNYTFDGPRTLASMRRLFRSIHYALRPGGVFVFDLAGPARAPQAGTRRGWWQGEDWAILVETSADRNRRKLTRAITCFRRVGRHCRRSEEVHVQRLFEPAEVARLLETAGFELRISDRYGRLRLPEGLAAFVARKPALFEQKHGAGLFLHAKARPRHMR